MSAISSRLLVFAKAPVPGQVKTRLAAAVGEQAATRLYQHMLAQVLQTARAFDPDYTLYLAGDRQHPWLTQHAAGQPCLPQLGSDLGERMSQALQQGLQGSDSVMLIGTDCPGIDSAYLQQAQQALHDHDWVIGPALDGGYVLIGCKNFHAAVLDNMPWSQPDLMQQTRRTIRQIGASLFELPPLHDIDTRDDLLHYPRLCAEAGVNC